MKKEKNNSRRPTGIVTALVTPFKKGKIDFVSLKRLVKFQLDGGVQGFVINGTTGESPTLSWEEVGEVFETVKKESDNSVPLVLGTGSNNTSEAIEKTAYVKKWGADAALCVVPYYNKPPQRALYAHFAAIAKSCESPLLLYNVPGRTVVSLSEETIVRLSEHKNIIGIKEASGDIDLAIRLRNRLGPDYLLSSGDDASCINFLLAGGDGVISVLSHIMPKQLRGLADRAMKNDRTVKEEYIRLEKLNKYLGIEANPIPVKAMLKLMGIIDSAELRLPLVELEGENLKKVEEEIKRLDII